MKRRLRRGGRETLNIYYRNLPGNVSGMSTFPSNINDNLLFLDGINMDDTKIANSTGPSEGFGHILVHEGKSHA